MPPSWASCGPLKRTGRPSNTTSPTSRSYTPVRTLIKVDLPAPFCPISACTSPRRTSNEASRRAGTPLNALLMPLIARRTSSPAMAPLRRLGWVDGAATLGLPHGRGARSMSDLPDQAAADQAAADQAAADQKAVENSSLAFFVSKSRSVLMRATGVGLPLAYCAIVSNAFT